MKTSAPGSINHWLSRWLAVQALLGLGLVCVAVYFVTNLSFVARQSEELQHKEEVIRHLVAEIRAEDELTSLRHKLDDFFVGHADLQLRLSTPAGALVYSTASTTQAAISQRQLTFDIPSMLFGTSALRAQMTLNTEADAELMRRLAWTLLACALAGSALIYLSGVWLVRRGLAPIHDLARQAAALAPDSLDQSLNGSGQTEELQPLVTQFNALLARLDYAYKQLDGFNADVAHELRNPLTILIGETELALSGNREANELREVLGLNLEELRRLAGLVNDMLFLSRAACGALARRDRIDSLAMIAAEVIDYHDASLQEAGLRAEVQGDSSGFFDTALLRRALSNLLSNATHFADPGSIVELAIDSDATNAVKLSVSNIGPTIPEEHQSRLFDRFYRASPVREHSETNHGLGLSIVAAIARMHGGKTFAESAIGRTTVGFVLPMGSTQPTTPI
jgi:two-component system heavy metal sensor histidine kinase CusS